MTTIRVQVREFHAAIGVRHPETPCVPSDARVRLRARLVTEEAFELLAALFPGSAEIHGLHEQTMAAIDAATPRVDMPEAADALADIDYVVEGTRLEFGIDGAPIAAEVHRSNIAKLGGPVDEHGKVRKPAGWTPPDVEGELRRQGWKEP